MQAVNFCEFLAQHSTTHINFLTYLAKISVFLLLFDYKFVNDVLFLFCGKVSEQLQRIVTAQNIQQTSVQAFGGGHVPVARFMPPFARRPNA